jgi:hypothetical protein
MTQKKKKGLKTQKTETNSQIVLDCLCDLAQKWVMSFTLAKFKIMHVEPHNPGYEYFMRRKKLRTIEEEKDIGVIVTRNLKHLSVQCSKAAGRVTAVLGQIRHNFQSRSAHLCKVIQAVRAPASGICSPTMVTSKGLG